MRSKLLILGLLLILLVANGSILLHERSLQTGQTVALALAPRDPRSLMQGDYMVLRYQLASEIGFSDSDGTVYLELNPDNTVRRVSKNPEQGLLPLAYEVKKGRVHFGIESFFFQEGQREKFEAARFAEVQLSSKGQASLVRLLDEEGRAIDP